MSTANKKTVKITTDTGKFQVISVDSNGKRTPLYVKVETDYIVTPGNKTKFWDPSSNTVVTGYKGVSSTGTAVQRIYYYKPTYVTKEADIIRPGALPPELAATITSDSISFTKDRTDLFSEVVKSNVANQNSELRKAINEASKKTTDNTLFIESEFSAFDPIKIINAGDGLYRGTGSNPVVAAGPVLRNNGKPVLPTGEELNTGSGTTGQKTAVNDLDVNGILKNMEDVLQAQLKEYDDALVKPKVYRYPLANLEVASEIGINFDFLRIRTVDHVSSLSAADVSGLSGLNANSTLANAQDVIFGGVNLSQVYLQNQRVKEYIILPMQPNISSSNAVDWGSDSMNIAKLVGGQMLNNYFNNTASKNAVDAFKELLVSVIQQGGNLADMAVSNKSSIAALLAGSLVNGNLLQRATGTVINPNMEMLFNGPRLRTFNFQFDFTPRFRKEAEEVRAIIATLKYRMAPRKTEGNAFLRSPHIFLLDYIYNGGGSPDEFTEGLRSDEELKKFTMNPHPYLNKIKPCAFVDFNVNYTPDGSYMTYKDGGSMTRYSINMSFAEIEPIYANDYETGTYKGKYSGKQRKAFNTKEMGY